MKAGFGCKLFGAQQVFTGITDAVTLLHSVVGCNFGSIVYHFAGCDMTDVRQTCTVLSDSDIVFSGEDSFRLALDNIRQLYHPALIFVVQGCVSDIIQDNLQAVAEVFSAETGIRVVIQEAAGYRGSFEDGFEAAMLSLLPLMAPPEGPCNRPRVNILGLGADDYRLEADIRAIRELLSDKVELNCVFGHCCLRDVAMAPRANLNLCLGRGTALAKAMEKTYGIPYAELCYPYGLTGAKRLWAELESRFGLDYAREERAFRAYTAEKLKKVYSYLESLYNIPVSVIGTRARAEGLSGFLSRELGLRVEVKEVREECRELEDFYDRIRRGDSAVLFASSFEQEIGDELEIPVLRFDYPVFDRVCLSDRPYVGPRGTVCLTEDLLNEIIHGRTMKGALYQ